MRPALIFIFLILSSVLYAQEFDNYTSNKGEGLFYKNVVPKNATLKQVAIKELSDDFKYADFYEDQHSGKLYLKTWSDILPLEQILKTGKDVKENPQTEESGNNEEETVADELAFVDDIAVDAFAVADEEVEMVEAVTIEGDVVIEEIESAERIPPFIELSFLIPGLTLEMPQHHLNSDRLQTLKPDRPGFRTDLVLKKINSLGLMKSQEVKTKGGGFNIIYDRLFINDEDENKLLIIWLNDDQVFANFLSNAGEWEFAEPKIIHTDIRCYNSDGTALSRDIKGPTDKSTLITELNSYKSGDNYYVGYSINSWESSHCFIGNLASCHLLRLNKYLEVERSVQIPSAFYSEGNEPFATDLQMKIYENNDTICAVIQSPNVGDDKLFVQCFDKELRNVNRLMYLSCTTSTYDDLIPVVTVPNGFLITYKENKENTTDIYTQFISNNGYPAKPVCVYSFSKDYYVNSIHMQKNEDNSFDYFITVEERKPGKAFLYHFQLPKKEYWDGLMYEITPENWKEDKKILEIEQLVSLTDKAIAQKKLIEYKRKSNTYAIKAAYVNNSLVILKYNETYQEGSFRKTTSLYYDQHSTLRFVKVFIEGVTQDKYPQKQSETVLVYYNQDGNKIWEIKTDKDGRVLIGDDVRSGRYLYNYKVNNPFDEFHLDNR